MVQAHGLSLSYGSTAALTDVSLTLRAGESVALMGPSGSGKSSLLHCLAGVLVPGSGEVTVAGAALHAMPERRRSQHRLAHLGMVFQFGNMVPELTLLENVMLPLQLLGRPAREARALAAGELDRLGVAEVADRRAGAVSGGQAQRAAVARALVHRPPVLFADEPTGALDSVSADHVLDALLRAADELGSALLVVTHENRVAAHCDRLMSMRDGRVSAPQAALS
ncbi:MAG TPA: ABC transporter ATP-binding protein [Segeticoccus sp.]|nr:ABC transporter ATP-binding protein [Segeticoccus sp.]